MIMTRATKSPFGILCALCAGAVIGYVIAQTKATSLASADAAEANAQKKNQNDNEAATAPPRISPVKGARS